MIVTALVAAAVALLPAPARGEGPGPYTPLVHVTGWYQMGPASIYGANNMHEAPAAQDIAFTLPAGHTVTMYFGGSCQVDGEQRLVSTKLSSVVCHGRAPR